MVNPVYVLVDLAICCLAIRSAGLVRGRAPWATLGWALAFVYGALEAVAWAVPPAHHLAGQVAYGILIAVAAAFITSAYRDEPQGEPWWWPQRLGRTRAERRPPVR